ncbi:GerAB/ArcD/ProY family transporter [Bacillus sp. REN16]|uniref:GerAB/ArcD/ProY family transporter n=1 Tax=Bacillus sp. REN16 TaxID=2887296 RepID=UPI001E56DE4B|nr:endospore germination permease [Bacillus sp. REN16]MCC3355821.1 spore germination protein [Bacillus sp. REN16]
MEYPKEITVIQATTILISTIIGVGLLALPLFAVRTADTGAPFVTLSGIAIASIGLGLITFLGMRHPQKSIILYGEDILGKWLGKVPNIVIILFFAVLTGLTSREFGAVVITAILKQTPLEVTVIIMLILAALSTRNEMNVFAYIHNFYLPIVLAPALIVVALSLKNANTLYLFPILGNEPGNYLVGAFTIAALFQGSFIITMIIPFMRHPQKAINASIWGMVIAGGLYLLIVIATVAVFGPGEILNLLWPTLELARTTSIPGNILQRLDVVFLSVWVIAVFTTLLSSYMFTVHSISQMVGLRDHKMLSFFILPIVFVIAMIPQNILQLYDVIQIFGRLGLIITIGYPALLICVDLIKKKVKKSGSVKA